jgi:two-component sensor histidine kinase
MIRGPDANESENGHQALARSWLSALSEPAALIRTNGELLESNRAFRRQFPDARSGMQLAAILADTAEKLSRYLLACLSGGEPLLGAIHSRSGHRFTCRGSRLSLPGQDTILLRVAEPDERFARLTTTVKDLNTLLRQREHEKALLHEALSERDILHRELQHRVKNNLQMLSGLLRAAKSDHEDEAARLALDDASQRFAAVSAAHQSLYQLESLKSVPADPLISQIAKAAALSSERESQMECFIADVRLPNDICTPLALIVNELVTNALKHARIATAPLKVEVKLTADDGIALLEVQDNGSGFHVPVIAKRGSGIGLVKGLVRQLRGKLEIDTAEGTRFCVSFPLPQVE